MIKPFIVDQLFEINEELGIAFIDDVIYIDNFYKNYEKIYELLDINVNSSLRFSKDIIFLSPRNGSQSPWSSKTEDIFTSCNLNEIQRIERIKGLETEDFSEKLLKKENFPFDYLTEEFSVGLKSIESFFTKPNKNSFSFKYLKNSYQSYIDANQKFGFGLNDQEINYLVKVKTYLILKQNCFN